MSPTPTTRPTCAPSATSSGTPCTTRGWRSTSRCSTTSRRRARRVRVTASAIMGERRVALCVARFYEELADSLEAGAREALAESGVEQIDRFEVPGAFELPLTALYAAQSGRYDA